MPVNFPIQSLWCKEKFLSCSAMASLIKPSTSEKAHNELRLQSLPVISAKLKQKPGKRTSREKTKIEQFRLLPSRATFSWLFHPRQQKAPLHVYVRKPFVGWIRIKWKGKGRQFCLLPSSKFPPPPFPPPVRFIKRKGKEKEKVNRECYYTFSLENFSSRFVFLFPRRRRLLLLFLPFCLSLWWLRNLFARDYTAAWPP